MIKHKIKRKIQEIKKYIRQRKYKTSLNIRFFNFWSIDYIENHWFNQFIKHYSLNDNKKPINFFSVMGPTFFTKIPINGKKIFFTGENVQGEHHLRYKNHALPFMDLALGFEYLNNEKYIRFPLWILYLVSSNDSFEKIKSKIEKINAVENRKNHTRNKFASIICRYDFTNIRGKIIDKINTIHTVECAGNFRNNTKDLKEKYGDRKLDYLKQFKFNICPENTNTKGYVTEKLLESFQSGCIPIYWGGISS